MFLILTSLFIGVYLSPNQQSFEADYLRVAETTGGGIH